MPDYSHIKIQCSNLWPYLKKGTLLCRIIKSGYLYQRLGWFFSHILHYLFCWVSKVTAYNVGRFQTTHFIKKWRKLWMKAYNFWFEQFYVSSFISSVYFISSATHLFWRRLIHSSTFFLSLYLSLLLPMREKFYYFKQGKW